MCAVAGLFIIAPAGYLIILFVVYKVLMGQEVIASWSSAAIQGFLLMSILPSLAHWLSFKYCKENFGWFKKK